MISVIFSISHGLLFFLTLHKIGRNTIITNVTCKHSFSPQKTFQLQGQRLMNESQGQRFCLFSAFSFIICMCVHVYRNYMESEFETAAGQVTEKCLHWWPRWACRSSKTWVSPTASPFPFTWWCLCVGSVHASTSLPYAGSYSYMLAILLLRTSACFTGLCSFCYISFPIITWVILFYFHFSYSLHFKKQNTSLLCLSSGNGDVPYLQLPQRYQFIGNVGTLQRGCKQFPDEHGWRR